MVKYVAPFPLGSSGKRRVEARKEGGGDYIVHKTLNWGWGVGENYTLIKHCEIISLYIISLSWPVSSNSLENSLYSTSEGKMANK